MQKKKINWWLVIAMYLIGIFLLLSAPLATKKAEKLSQQFSYQHYSKEQLRRFSNQSSTYDYSAIRYLNPLSLLANGAKSHWQKEVPITGQIAIPAVKINLPIVNGITNYYLSIGAGEMKPTDEMGKGNYSLASHNMNDDKVLFSPLRHIKKGNHIYTTDGQFLYTYQCTAIDYVQPQQIEVIYSQKDNPKITLVTCSMDGKRRLIVQGRLSEKQKLTTALADKYFRGSMNE